MPHYKDPSNGLHFLDSADFAHLLPAGCVEIPGEEAAALSAPPASTPEQIAAERTANRAAAYRDESDPLFFKAQRNEATLDDWKAKIEEIKARYP